MKHPLHTTRDCTLFIIFAVALLLVLGIFHMAFAEPVDLGEFGEYHYYYDDSSIEYHDNTRIVWVGTPDPRFNFFHEENYGGALGQVAVDCSGHASALLAGAIFDHEGNVLHKKTIPDQDWAFFSIEPRIVQDELYRLLCVQSKVF